MARQYRIPNRPLLNNKLKPIVIFQNYIDNEEDSIKIRNMISKDYYALFLSIPYEGVDIKILKS